MSDEAALLNAIVAHADEDTPRLAYADWLDENGDPPRAAFIRVQCRLAEMSPAEPDWVDLREEEDELLVRLGPRKMGGKLSRAKRFHFSDFTHDDFVEPFRRGFPYFIDYQTYAERLTPKQTAGMI